MFFAAKTILVIVSISLVLGYPQELPLEEQQPDKEEAEVEEIPKIFNTPAEIEVQPNSVPILGEDAKFAKKDVLTRNDRSAAYSYYYYPGVYYYPPKFRWNPYYYYNYYNYWWL
ncbi:hypothetical protein RP20_CCG006126 [Aedes albopictus]|nr:hypothetical protein RP20_CCG006126 [Aedes albopictus]